MHRTQCTREHPEMHATRNRDTLAVMHARFVLRRIVPHIVITVYGIISLLGLWGTMFHQITHVPWLRTAVFFSYGMMAPYQGDVSWNNDFIAQGLRRDGVWEAIDLAPYYPQIFGEANAMQFLRSFAAGGRRLQGYVDYALQLKAREAEQGRAYEEVRLVWREWPRSPGGFYFLARAPFFMEEREYARVR